MPFTALLQQTTRRLVRQCVAAIFLVTASALADSVVVPAHESRRDEQLVLIGETQVIQINLSPAIKDARERARRGDGFAPPGGTGASAPEGGVSGACDPITVAHTDSTFSAGQYIMQAGFAQGEACGASFTADASHFPIKVDQLEILFATSAASVQTTTEWSVLIYEGNPTAGGAAYYFSSDGKILPHLVMPPGTTGTIIQFVVDPGDPDQIYLNNPGNGIWSFAFRIDQHHNQTQNPCFISPPTASNAFPTTDTSGLAQPSRNWLYAVDCGAFGCPAGWTTFQSLPALCRPSGDWVMRGMYTPVECGGTQIPGACCLGSSCLQLTESECQLAAGVFQGENTPCGGSTCQTSSLVPCCFAQTGGCIELSASDCALAGGVAGPAGTPCSQHICFPEGACCLPSGACVDGVSPEECAALSGVFQGDGTGCSSTTCPQPTGAACFPNGFCLVLTQAQATAAGASWQGPGTNCADANQNGTADACETAVPGDINGDGDVDGADLTLLLSAWSTNNAGADIDGDGTVGGSDLASLLSNWTG